MGTETMPNLHLSETNRAEKEQAMPSSENDLFELKAEIKEVKEDGTFQGIASVYDVEDLTADVIEKGAFRKTVAETPTIPVLWQHDRGEVIGQGTVKEWQSKLLIDGSLDIENDPLAMKAYRKLKAGLIKGLSIGFRTIKATFSEVTENGATRYVRRIQELKLYEVSVVTFPALPAAQVTRVKSVETERFEALEKQVQALQAKFEATPAPEPAQAKEPPPKGDEPAHDHSALSSTIDQILKEVRA